MSATKDERVSRLEEFFENASVEYSVFDQAYRAGPEAEQTTREVRVQQRLAPVVSRPQQGHTGARENGLESVRDSRMTRKPGEFVGAIKARFGRVRLADPRDTALRTLAMYEARMRERLQRFSFVSVSLPSADSVPFPTLVRGVVIESKYRVPGAVGAAVLLIIVRMLVAVKRQRVAAVLEEKERARRELRGEKQRARFRQMFGGEDGVDASVFSAVRQMGENVVEKNGMGEFDDIDDVDDVDDVDEQVDMESSMEEIKKAYKDFVKNSKLGEGEFWNIEDEVEAFEKIEIEFDKE